MAPLLAIRDLAVRLGGIVALDGVSLEVGEGEIVGLIGPNGAGKTTLINAISGLHRHATGSARLAGTELIGLAPHRIARRGLARTFQSEGLFASLTVRGNIRVGAEAGGRPGAAARTAGLLAAFGLEAVADRPVAGLPTHLQKHAEIARALAGEPRIVLLDEPAGGLSAAEAEQLGALIRTLRARHGLAVVLVEHSVPLVMAVSDRLLVLDAGRVIAEGLPTVVRSDPAVVAAWLGRAP